MNYLHSFEAAYVDFKDGHLIDFPKLGYTLVDLHLQLLFIKVLLHENNQYILGSFAVSLHEDGGLLMAEESLVSSDEQSPIKAENKVKVLGNKEMLCVREDGAGFKVAVDYSSFLRIHYTAEPIILRMRASIWMFKVITRSPIIYKLAARCSDEQDRQSTPSQFEHTVRGVQRDGHHRSIKEEAGI